MNHKIFVGVCVAGMALSLLAMQMPQMDAWVRGAYVKQQTLAVKQKAEQQTQVQTKQQTQQIRETQDTGETVRPIQPAEMLPAYKTLYEKNHDLIGWLSIAGTVIDYPVMQTPEDEDYYLDYDFYGNKNVNGSLILDTDSCAGTGTAENDYKDGTEPSTNLIIHGHTMKSGQMFGGLKKYTDASYGKKHHTIVFDSLYEHREYELLAVFYSQVYAKTDQVFKYYQFFEADTKEAFLDWYENIRALSLYDTGVTAAWGDTFLTLSCCSYQVEDGRFVVVAKRVV